MNRNNYEDNLDSSVNLRTEKDVRGRKEDLETNTVVK